MRVPSLGADRARQSLLRDNRLCNNGYTVGIGEKTTKVHRGRVHKKMEYPALPSWCGWRTGYPCRSAWHDGRFRPRTHPGTGVASEQGACSDRILLAL